MSLCALELKRNVNKFAISDHTAFKLDVQALRSYLSLIVNLSFISLPNKKASTAKDHGVSFRKFERLRMARIL